MKNTNLVGTGRPMIWAMLLVASLGAAADAETPEPEMDSGFREISPSESVALFASIAKLAGRWTGASTKGWTDTVTVDVIANGSVVRMNSFDAHPDEQMLTVFTLDKGELILTHYCVARNQPRMRAEQISHDGSTLWFRFVDGGNLTSRDVGHMDSMRLTLRPDGGYTSRWTWYENGSEEWMEEIVHHPLVSGTPQ